MAAEPIASAEDISPPPWALTRPAAGTFLAPSWLVKRQAPIGNAGIGRTFAKQMLRRWEQGGNRQRNEGLAAALPSSAVSGAHLRKHRDGLVAGMSMHAWGSKGSRVQIPAVPTTFRTYVGSE